MLNIHHGDHQYWNFPITIRVFSIALHLCLLLTQLCSTGHEHPFSIALSCLRDSADQQQRTNNNTLLADGTEASFLAQLPKEKQCQFVLKPRLQAPMQLRRGRGCRSVVQPDRYFIALQCSAELFLASYMYPRAALIPECNVKRKRLQRGEISLSKCSDLAFSLSLVFNCKSL